MVKNENLVKCFITNRNCDIITTLEMSVVYEKSKTVIK